MAIQRFFTLILLSLLLALSSSSWSACAQQECWAIQVGSYAYLNHAKAQQTRLRQWYPHVTIIPIQSYYTVRVQALSAQEVLSVRKRLIAQGYRDCLVKKTYLPDSLHNPVNVRLPSAKTLLALEQPPRVTPQPAVVRMRTGKVNIQQGMMELTERDAIWLALRFNPQVKNAEIDRVLQKYRLAQTARTFQWQFTLNASASYTTTQSDGQALPDSENYQINPSASKKTLLGSTLNVSVPQSWPPRGHQPTAQISLNQPLLRGLNREVIERGVNDALDDERVNRMQLKQDIMNVVANVVKSYRALIQANNNVEITEQSLKEANTTYAHNAVQIRLGKIAKTVNISQKSQIASLKLSLLRAENSRDQARQNLLNLLGLDPNMNINVPKDIQLSIVSLPELETVVDQGLAHNVGYQSQLINYKKNKRALAQARDDMRWKLDFNASVNLGSSAAPGRGFPKLTNGKNISQTVGLSLEVPIDDLDLKVGLASANITLQKAARNLHQAQRDLVSRIKNAMTDLNSTALQLAIAKQTVELKQQVYDVYQVKLRLGQGSDLDALEAQNALISAKNTLINTKISYLNALTDLYVLLGRLLDEWKIELDY